MTAPIRIVVVGPGRVGSFWARTSIRAGFELDLRARNLETCPPDLRQFATEFPAPVPKNLWYKFDLIILAVPDKCLPGLVGQIRDAAALQTPDSGPLIAHASGQLAPDVLTQAGVPRERSVAAHPLYPFSTRQSSPDPSRVFHALEGLPQATEKAGGMILRSGARYFAVNEINRPLYHLACVVASNHLITLFHVASSLMERAAGDHTIPPEALRNLIQASAENLQQASSTNALTGPAQRGDSSAISEHMAALEQFAPEYHELYRHLLHATLPLIPETSRDSIERLLKTPRR